MIQSLCMICTTWTHMPANLRTQEIRSRKAELILSFICHLSSTANPRAVFLKLIHKKLWAAKLKQGHILYGGNEEKKMSALVTFTSDLTHSLLLLCHNVTSNSYLKRMQLSTTATITKRLASSDKLWLWLKQNGIWLIMCSILQQHYWKAEGNGFS